MKDFGRLRGLQEHPEKVLVSQGFVRAHLGLGQTGPKLALEAQVPGPVA